jgi:hypothetical protein
MSNEVEDVDHFFLRCSAYDSLWLRGKLLDSLACSYEISDYKYNKTLQILWNPNKFTANIVHSFFQKKGSHGVMMFTYVHVYRSLDRESNRRPRIFQGQVPGPRARQPLYRTQPGSAWSGHSGKWKKLGGEMDKISTVSASFMGGIVGKRKVSMLHSRDYLTINSRLVK